MSSKQRQRKGKGGAKASSGAASTKASSRGSSGPPFGLVAALALMLSVPALLQYNAGVLPFDETATRFLIALAVSWALISLVSWVVSAVRASGPSGAGESDQPGPPA
jgi:hypothetical protein